jgi:hypothetical protein
MPSHSRNSRFAVQVLRLAFAGVAQGGALLAGSVAHADQPNKFVMAVYENGVGGDRLVSGDYAGAMKQMHYARPSDETRATNECVAYTMTAQFETARSVCDVAVKDAKKDILHSSSVTLWDRTQLEEFLAIAYSNRAVLDWLSHDTAAAERDLSDASALSPQGDYVAHNMTALHSSQENGEKAVAQVETMPRS